MSQKTSSTLFVLPSLICIALVVVFLHTPVQAQSITTGENHSNCVNCHENLYFLHDTGNWFCLRESPMECVDCHGGDPKALTEETAHLNRSTHPVVNEDISKCQECHPEECDERVELFDQTAGISQVLVAAPYTLAYSTEDGEAAEARIPQEKSSRLSTFREVMPLVLIASLALVIYFTARKRHP